MNKTRRSMLGYAGAFAVLALLPVLPEWMTYLSRVMTGFALALLAPIVYCAYVPVKFTIGALRAGALGFCILLVNFTQSSKDPKDLLPLGAAIFFLFSVAVGPAVPQRTQRILYGGAIASSWILAFFGLFSGDGHPSLISFASAAVYPWLLTSFYIKWLKTGKSELVSTLNKWQCKCKSFLSRTFASPEPRKQENKADLDRKLIENLRNLTRTSITEDDRYRELLEICGAHPGHELSCKVAYWAATSRRDFQTAARVIRQARDLNLDLRDRPDREAAKSNPASWIYWRESDPAFAELQDALSSKEPALQYVFA